MSNSPKLTKTATELGIGSGDGVMHSNAAGLEGGTASPQNLELEIAALRAENEKLQHPDFRALQWLPTSVFRVFRPSVRQHPP